MRPPILILLFTAVLALPASGEVAPETSLELGLRAFRAGDYASAVLDLQRAAVAMSGTVDRIGAYETALVHLALAQFRSGDEDGARESIQRVGAADSLVPTYASLPLGEVRGEFETLTRALVPSAAFLPSSMTLGTNGTNGAQAPEQPSTTSQQLEQQPTTPLPPVTPISTDELVARERTRIQSEADARVAAIEREARERIAAAERRAAEAERLAAAPPVVQPAPSPRLRVESLTALRQAQALADHGQVDEANRIYTRLANGNEAREVIGEAALGLYRTGDFRASAAAFARLGAFGRGEEDLRYYYAIALYEAGDAASAQHELKCALPFIERTDEVERYRTRIDQMAALQTRN